jgi:ElaB/YqjD/DUF883 family membrane-anchored ribosome-binding protein
MRQYDAPGGPTGAGRGAGSDAGDRDPEEIRVEIAQTRAEMSTTIDAIQDRLAPEVLSEQAKEVARDATDQAKTAAQEVLQDAVREVKDAAKEVTAHAVHEVREAARDATADAKDAAWDATVGRAEDAVSTAGETARGMGSMVIETIKQNPVPAALAGLSLYWLFKHRAGGQSASGRGSASAGYGTPGSYASSRAPQAYPIRTGYASQAERDAMMADAGRTTSSWRAGDGAPSQGGESGGMMSGAGRMASDAASSAADTVSGATSSVGEMASDAASTAGQMVSGAGETATDLGSTVLDVIQRNPVPAALVGIGVGWLYMNRSSGQPDYRAHSGTHYRYPSGATGRETSTGYRDGDGSGGIGSTVGQAAGQVGDMVGSAQEQVSELAGTAQEYVGEMAGTVSDRTRRAPGQLERMVQERPLVAAAVAASLGAAVGMWLPPTQVEQQLMGPAREQAMGRAQDVATETIEKVGDVVEEVRTTASEQAREKGLTV